MGVVYSGEDLRNGSIPQDGAHIHAAQLVLDRVGSLEWVPMVLVHGSVPEGRSNRRSDLDVLVTVGYGDTLTHFPHSVSKVRQALEEIQDATKVHIEANIWPENEPVLARRQRMYDMLYSWHLRDSFRDARGLRGEPDQLTLIVANSLPSNDTDAIRDVAQNYVIYKQGGFTNAPLSYADGEPRSLAALQRGLELPKAIGRKLAQLIASCEGREVSGNNFVFDASLLDEPTQTALMATAEIDKSYSELLESYYGSGLENLSDRDIAEYVAWIESIYGKVIANGLVATAGLSRFINDYTG